MVLYPPFTTSNFPPTMAPSSGPFSCQLHGDQMSCEDGITLAQAKTQLAAWMAADAAVARGQSMTVDGTRFDRTNAAVVTQKLNYWQLMVKRLSGRGITVRGVTFQ